MITRTNAAAIAFLCEDSTGKTYGAAGRYVLLHRDGTPCPMCDLPFTRAIERGEESSNVEVRLQWEDGTDRVAMTAATPIRDEQGRVIEAVPVFLDVTERIQPEEALGAS
jgi:hypothetical protein